MPKEQFLYKTVYNDLEQKIRSGEISPGSKLPGENELCKKYEVSIITVKRAMELLAADNLIQRVPGRGTFAVNTIQKEISNRNKSVERGTAVYGNNLIGVILDYTMVSFGVNLMLELDRLASAAGYRICLRFSYGDREKETEEIEFLLSLGVVGLIIIPCFGCYYNTFILKLIIEKFPVVLLDKRMEGIPVPSIRTDNTDAIFRLVDYLVSQNRTKIGLITVEDTGTVSLLERNEAFRKKIEQLRLPVIKECVLPQAYHFMLWNKPAQQYTNLIEDYLKENSEWLDGVICTEYGNLLSFVEAAANNHIDVMTQILPCCIDEVYHTPGGPRFTHVKQDETKIADKAIEVLLTQISGGEVCSQEIKIPGIFFDAKQ